MSELRPFHIAFPVDDLAAARHFYGVVLGLPEGRSAEQWIDFNLFGHQIVAHHKPKAPDALGLHSNPVDGHEVPIPHFGVVLKQDDWEALAGRVREADVYTSSSNRIRGSRENPASNPPCSSWTLPETPWSSRPSATSASSSPSNNGSQPGALRAASGCYLL